MSSPVTIKLCLCTEFGPCGSRLERGVPLPTYQFLYDDSPDGREKAEVAAAQLTDYMTKYHAVPKKSFTKEASKP